MTIGICYVQRFPASVGREALAGRRLVDHLRREYDVVTCDGVLDAPPVGSSGTHLLVNDVAARRFDVIYIEGGAFWGFGADATWKVPETLLRSFVAGGGVLVVADVGRNEAGVRRDASPYERAHDLFGTRLDWGNDGSSVTYGADLRSNWDGRPTSVIATPEQMLYSSWLDPVYTGIDQILAVQPVVLSPMFASPLITGNRSTGETLSADLYVDRRTAFVFGCVQQLGLGYVVLIAGLVSHDMVVEANPDNARWISNIMSFLVDEVSRERERRGMADPLRVRRTLPHAEWAAELGRLAEMHNDIEKRIRDLIERISIDEEQGRSDPGWAEREMLAAIPAKERARVGSGSVEQLLASLYWVNLIAIVGRQWRLFERIFGDLGEFRSKAQIVNDRPHAHAKSLDAADIALYRRELNWFKAKLDKSTAS